VTSFNIFFSGILVPIVVSAMVGDELGVGPWQTVFYITLAMLFVEFVVFALLGKGEVQPWNNG